MTPLSTRGKLRSTAVTLSALLLAACGGSSSGSSDSSSSAPTPTPTPVSGLACASTGSKLHSLSVTDLSSGAALASQGATGWASQGTGTTGGAGAPASNIYIVRNRAELKAALANSNSATYASNATTAKNEAKIIYLMGSIYGTDLGNGQYADEAYYKTQSTTAANWDWALYLKSVDTAYMADLNTRATAGEAAAVEEKAKISKLGSARTTLSNIQKEQIQFVVPSNTTIVGLGSSAKLIDGYFSINASSNIIIRNLELQAPTDLAPSYTNTVGKEEWNARFKAISVVTGKQLWFDHLTLSDGTHLDTEKLTLNGVTKTVQRHDGLLDIEDSSDYVTVSYSVFKNHDKTNMVGGSGDGNGAKERDYNRLTFSNNIWQDSVQRAPRARFGQIHIYNNYYTGNTDAETYAASYYIGMGAESRILSEANVFDMTGSKAAVAKVISNLNGYQFKDVGSWFNGVAASTELEAAAKAALDARWSSAQSAATSSGFTLGAYTNSLGWTPTYSYTAGTSADTVRSHNIANAGAGKLWVNGSSSSRPQLSDSVAANFTLAKALAGSDNWQPQAIDTCAITPDYTVAQDGSGTHTTIQAALNAASTSTKARTYIKVKAGTYNELLVAASTTTAITLYSAESDATKVIVTNNLYQNSPVADYNAVVSATTYNGNTDASTLYTACAKKTTIGKECSTTLRVRNNGFNAVNMTFQNTWDDSGSSNQALAVMIDKADLTVFDNTRLISNQDTLYLSNSGKRSYFVGGEIAGDVDFIFGPGTGAFDGVTVRYIGTRKSSGGFIAAPSTLSSQAYGFVFQNCAFVADSATTADSIYLARQWDDGTGAIGKMIVRNSTIGSHIALGSSPWNATAINGTAVNYGSGSDPYLGEYHNVQIAAVDPSAVTTPIATSSPTPSPTPTNVPSPTPTTLPLATAAPIAGSTVLTHSVQVGAVNTSTSANYNSTADSYTLTSAGSLSSTAGGSDSFQFAYRQISGDFTLVARLSSLEAVPTGLSTGNWRAGLMIRNGLSESSRYYGIIVRGIPRIQWEQRLADSAAVNSSSLLSLGSMPSATAPVWLKLQRTGQVISVYYSTSTSATAPTTWSTAKTQDFSTATGAVQLDSTVYVGLVGVSGSTSVTSTSIFDGVGLTTASSGAKRRF